MSPGPALALLGAVVAAALLATHTASLAVIVVVLTVVAVRAARHAWVYVAGIAFSAATIFVITPFVETLGSHPIWTGPIVPVVGELDVTREELWSGAHGALRFAAVGLAFAVYALVLDHDRLLEGTRFARRFVLTVVLATRLAPTLDRDARALAEAMRARGIEVRGVRTRTRLLSPLLAGSLERALNLAEAMEARGYGRGATTRLPRASWSNADRAAVAFAAAVVALGVLWL
ncbi:MAG: energy-coupling factor transporter transmembrane protein EcfT [Actinobacteria bacterium]|nr:MAG: energy-coupling factor transporter transmembrane protein EcfT [Actinomycetota bacterium]